MPSIDDWKSCELLSVFQAALLIVGTDPASMPQTTEGWRHTVDGFRPMYIALQGAILSGRLKATIRKDRSQLVLDAPPGAMAHFQEGGVQRIFGIRPDWYGTLIEVTDLREWMAQRGIASEFFFPHGIHAADYLNPRDPCFSAKLYAAIGAWSAVKADPSLSRGKTVKTALVTWLNKHAAQYGLTKDDGDPNNQAIEEVSKIANWVTKGGAPKTPA